MAFEVGWSSGRLRFGLWVPAAVSAGRVARVVEAAWPGAVTEVLPAEASVPGGAEIAGGELRLAGPEWFSLRVDQPADPYRLLLAALSGLGSGEAGVVQVLARPATRRQYARCRKAAIALRTGRPRSKLVRFIDFWMTKSVPQRPSLSTDPTRASDARGITEKASSLCFEATVRYSIVTPTGGHGARQALKAEGHGLVGAFAMFDGRNHLTRKRLARPWQALYARRLGKGDLYAVGEMAALAHLPVDRTVAGLSRAGAHAVVPPPEVRSDGKVLGRTEAGGRRPVGVSVADARQHLHVLGATGSGKSTLLTNLVLQDVAAQRGAVVIDPKGDLINDILDRLPTEAAGRVVVLDPDDDSAPPAMNVLDAAEPHLAVDHLVGIFHRLFEAYWGPRTDDVLRVAALDRAAPARRHVGRHPPPVDRAGVPGRAHPPAGRPNSQWLLGRLRAHEPGRAVPDRRSGDEQATRGPHPAVRGFGVGVGHLQLRPRQRCARRRLALGPPAQGDPR